MLPWSRLAAVETEVNESPDVASPPGLDASYVGAAISIAEVWDACYDERLFASFARAFLAAYHVYRDRMAVGVGVAVGAGVGVGVSAGVGTGASLASVTATWTDAAALLVPSLAWTVRL